MNLPWTEFWGFLNGFSNLKSKEGLDKLEVYLGQKKLHKILELQEKSAIGIISEGVKSNTNYISTSKTQTKLIEALNEFIRTLNELKANLDLKENNLSNKFENYVQVAKAKKTSYIEFDIENSEISENTCKDVLKQYMSSILKACKLCSDSTRCYFDIFKTSRDVFEILHSDDLFIELTYSPKSIANSSSLKSSVLTERRRSNQIIHTKSMKR